MRARGQVARRAASGRARVIVRSLAALLLGGPSVAWAGDDASAGASESIARWNFGAAAAWVQPLSNSGERLVAALDRQGWGDDIPPGSFFGLYSSGHAYPYDDSVSPSSLRVWVDRAVRPRLAARIEFSLATSTIARGYSDVDGSMDFTLSPASLALLPVFGGRSTIGLGPSLDLLTVTDEAGAGRTRLAPGLVMLLGWRLYRGEALDAGLLGGGHYVPRFQPRDIANSIRTRAFHPPELDPAYFWVGVSLERRKLERP